ncbi:hypothetical protein G3A_02780 [Bacillus sp. 17376]|nr:hypothetical protein G3A_02780 [Bacillus sp. 17376]
MLLFYEKPIIDETLCSFTYRTAKKNLMTNLSWIRENFKKSSALKLNEYEINWLENEKLKKLSNFLGIDLVEAQHLTYSHFLRLQNIKFNNIQKNNWFLYSKCRVCPLCVRESQYQRKVWGSSYLTACVRHKIMLIDSCYNCGTNITVRGIVLDNCQSCNQKISSLPFQKISNNDLITFQNIIEDGINHNSYSTKHPWIKDFPTYLFCLEFISLWAVQLLDNKDFSLDELKMEYDGGGLERHSLKNAKTVEQATCIYFRGYNILKDWPTGFYRFIQRADNLKRPNFTSFINNIIPNLTTTVLEPITREANKYYFTKHYGKGELKRGETDFIRNEEIKFLCPRFNAGLTKEDLFNEFLIEEENIKFKLIIMNELIAWMNEYENFYTKKDLMERWKISSKAATNILKADLFKPSFHYKVGAVSTWVVPYKTIKTMETNLKIQVKEDLKMPVSLNKAIEWIGPGNAALLFNGMLVNRIKYCNPSGSIQEITLAKEDIFFYGKEQILHNSKKKGYISFRDIEFLLGVKRSDICYWVKTKKFGEMKLSPNLMIPINNFLTFQSGYLTTMELSFLTGIPMKTILKKVSIGRLPIISGPKLNDGQRILFEKKKIMSYIENK